MATLANFVEALSIVTAVEMGELRLVGRNLREKGILPQYGRGLHAAELEPMHVAALLVGMLIGRKVPVHKTAERVGVIGRLPKRDGIAVRAYSLELSERAPLLLLPPNGSFENALTEIISTFSQTESAVSWHGLVQAVGLKFGSAGAYPWIQVKDPRRIAIGITSGDRCSFGLSRLLHAVDTGGLIEESQVSNGVLLDVASLFRKDRSVSEHISYLRKKHAQSQGVR